MLEMLMKKHKFIIQEEANNEIIQAYLWYETKQEGLGEKFIDALETCYVAIDINPNTFEKKYKFQRQAIIKNFPYVVMYEQEENKIIIYAVFNTHQEPTGKFR